MDKDYDLALCKIPRKDKDGNDITTDNIGKGGRHRKDGTYSGAAYDIEVIEELPVQNISNPTPYPIEYEGKRSVEYENLPLWGQLIVNVAEEAIPIAIEGLTEVLKVSFNKWHDNRCQKRAEKQAAQATTSKRALQSEKKILQTKAEKILKESIVSSEVIKLKATTIVLPDEFDDACEQYSINMTSEEAQKELLDAFILYVLSARKLWKVSHANIVDVTGQITDVKTMIEKLSDPLLIENINTILDNNPTLLEEWQSVALSGILGCELIINTRFVPIDGLALRQCLMIQPE